MLEQEGIYNDISPKLREKLEKRIEGFGRIVRYKFNLGRENPDPQKYNGQIIYPSLYNLDPIQWKITDTDEDRKEKQKVKNIGIIESVERDDRGNPQYRFTRIKLRDAQQGLISFNMEIEEDKTAVASLELHPKNGNGMFSNPQMVAMFSRIDENQLATKQREERSARKLAMDFAEKMSDKEIVQFADAMANDEWDSTKEIGLLRNQVEDLAETSPAMFNDLVSSKKIEIQALIKRAIDNKILNHNPAEGSLSWTSTNQSIITFGVNIGDKSDIEKFAQFVLEGGKKAEEFHSKIKSLIEKPVKV